MTIINLPLDYTTVDLSDSDLVWKQIIPMDKEIDYGGKKLKFSKDILERLQANYELGVTDQTAFQLVDDQNRHDTEQDVALNRNWDPQRYRGNVKKLVVDEKQGLMGGFKLTEEGLALVRANPNLGVSASIKPNYVGEDGKVHDFVLRHVVGTLDPKIKHMSPWQAEGVNLSTDDDPNEEVYDLTTTEPKQADTQTPDTSGDNKLSVDKAEYELMQKQIEEFGKGEELLNQILAEVDTEDNSVTNLSQPAEDPRITELQNRAAASEWRAQRAEYVKSGVPVKLLNLCDGIMSVYDAPAINLSDGASVDPRDTIKSLLDESKGLIDLSDEQGHGMSVDERQAEKNAADEFVGGFMSAYNIDLF